MARLASDAKMGFYPTPNRSLWEIEKWIESENSHLLDPCCGEGEALNYVADSKNTTWGVELDVERAGAAYRGLDNVVQGSIFEARINPLECMGLLWLNPPYTTDNGERAEIKFLKHSIKWLCSDGVLVFIIPEHVLYSEKNREWIGQHFYDITVVRLHRDDYPVFKQVVLFGKKRKDRVEEGEPIPLPGSFPHIEDIEPEKYIVPQTEGPKVFQSGIAITEDDVRKNRPHVIRMINEIMGKEQKAGTLSPLLPLRKGHLVALMTAGVLDGKVQNPDGSYMVVKGYSERIQSERTEDDKKIKQDTYIVGIRVIEKGGWYDVK